LVNISASEPSSGPPLCRCRPLSKVEVSVKDKDVDCRAYFSKVWESREEKTIFESLRILRIDHRD
jgi:hypothetical protein